MHAGAASGAETATERGFLWAFAAAFVAAVFYRIGIFPDVLFWVSAAALLLAALAVGRLLLAQGGIGFGANRHRTQIIGWTVAALIALAFWAAGFRDVQSALPFLKANRKLWNAIHDFHLFFPIAFTLIAAAIAWSGTRAADEVHRRPIERTFVTNMTAKIAGVPMVLTAGGLIMVLMLAGLRGIDQEIWKAARMDGIPMWKTYLFIVIPMMRPVFITTLVIIASGIVRFYDLVVAQTGGGPGISSQVPAIYVYDYMFSGQNLGQGFAASTMMLLAVAIVIIPWAYLEFGSKNRG